MDVSEIETLILRISQGDRDAFSRLFDLTSAKLMGICLRVLNDRSLAEDALQDAYVKIWSNAKRFKMTGQSPMAWLVTIARNAAIDHQRKRAPEVNFAHHASYLSAPGLTPEQSAIAHAQAARLAECLDKLEPERSEAVKSVYLKGHTYKELAQTFSVPLNTMRTWLRRSLISLRECMSHDE